MDPPSEAAPTGNAPGDAGPDTPAGDEGEDRIVAMARGPQTVFVYWRLEGPRSAKVARELGLQAQWVLRTLDLTDDTSRSVPVDPSAGNHYVEATPGHVYGFELAARAGRKWRTVCRTARVEVPSDRPAAGRSAPAAQGPGGRRPAPGLGKFVAPVGEGAGGAEVPGLSFESTPLRLGSSPLGAAHEDEAHEQ